MKKKILISIIIGIIMLGLVYFFFPKNAGGTCGFCPGPPAIEKTEYGCIGIKKQFAPPYGCMDCGSTILCFGWKTSEKKCYTRVDGQEVEVPECRQPDTWQGILDLCPSCYFRVSSAAQRQGDMNKAIEICGLFDSSRDKDICILQLSSFEIERNDLEEAGRICSETSTAEQADYCLVRIAEKIAETDIEKAVSSCSEIRTQRAKDGCYYSVALKAQTESKSLEICSMIEEDIFSPPCKQRVEEGVR